MKSRFFKLGKYLSGYLLIKKSQTGSNASATTSTGQTSTQSNYLEGLNKLYDAYEVDPLFRPVITGIVDDIFKYAQTNPGAKKILKERGLTTKTLFVEQLLTGPNSSYFIDPASVGIGPRTALNSPRLRRVIAEKIVKHFGLDPKDEQLVDLVAQHLEAYNSALNEWRKQRSG